MQCSPGEDPYESATTPTPRGPTPRGLGCRPPPQGRWMPAAVRMPAVVQTAACHSRRFKGERPIGAATGQQSQPSRPCAKPPIGGLRPTVSCQRYRPLGSMGAEGA